MHGPRVEPLLSLPPPLEPQLLLVDALDEALTTTSPLTIPDLLGPRLGRFPSWLRLLATSRPLLDVRAKLGWQPEFEIDQHQAENTDDLRRLVRTRLAGGRLDQRVAEDGRRPDEVADAIVDAAAGSFLVATMALDAVELSQMTFQQISDLPPGVEAAYGAFFAAHLAELGCRDPRWAWRSPRGKGLHLTSALEMPLVELATGQEVAWFPLVWASATPDSTGRTWALLTQKELYVLTFEET